MSRVISTDGALSPLGVTSITDGDPAPLAGLSAGIVVCPGATCITEGDRPPTSIIEGDRSLVCSVSGVPCPRATFLTLLPPRLQMPLGVFLGGDLVTGAVVGGDLATGVSAGGDLDGDLE